MNGNRGIPFGVPQFPSTCLSCQAGILKPLRPCPGRCTSRNLRRRPGCNRPFRSICRGPSSRKFRQGVSVPYGTSRTSWTGVHVLRGSIVSACCTLARNRCRKWGRIPRSPKSRHRVVARSFRNACHRFPQGSPRRSSCRGNPTRLYNLHWKVNCTHGSGWNPCRCPVRKRTPMPG